MRTGKAMIHSLKATETVVIVSENGNNDVVVSCRGKLTKAVYNVFVNLYYVDDIYGVIGDDPQGRTLPVAKSRTYCRAGKELKVLKSCAGYYIGTWDDGPNCRLSTEYYKDQSDAEDALKNRNFTPRNCEENKFCSGGMCVHIPFKS